MWSCVLWHMGLCVCGLTYPACRVYAPYYSNLWPIWLHHLFQDYLIKATIFWKKKLLNIKCVFWFSVQLLSETFLILKTIQWYRHKRKKHSCKVPFILVTFLSNLNFFDIFSKKKVQISNIIKILPLGAELFHAEGRGTEGHDEANSRFS
jgi:hypothetical protein